jgi:predicted membrane-bound spermidine synthase
VILIDLPDPQNAQLNRYYTVEFFKEVKEALHPNGVLGFSLSGSENYNNPESRLLSSSIYKALAKVFDHILVVPGSRNIFLASSNPLTYDIAKRLSERGITTQFINKAYLTARLTKDRISQAEAMVSEDAKVNEDFLPSSYFAQIRYWLSHFQESLILPIIFIIVLSGGIAALLLKSNHRPAAAAIGASGFAGMGLEIILLFAFQSFYGYVYQQLGLIFTAFLIGTALGALRGMKSKAAPRTLMIKQDLSLACIALAFPFLLIFIQQHALALENLSAWFIFPFLTLIIGFMVGAQFQAAARMMFSSVAGTAAHLYSLDFLGSALGAFVVSAFAVPLLGMKTTCFALGAMKLATTVLLTTSRESIDHPQKPAMIEPATRNLAVVLCTFLAIGALIASDKTGLHLHAISFTPVYHWALLFLLAYGTLQAVARDNLFHLPGQSLFKQTKSISLGRMLTFLVFSLAVFFPIFRCYFTVPYLFCHVCPRQCIFGYLRPYLVPAALIMNIEKRHWCFNLCPIGTLHDCQSKKAKQQFSLPKSFGILPVIILIGTAVSYFLVKIHAVHPEAHGIDWYNIFYKNIFAVDWLVLLIGATLVLFAFFTKRPFCDLLCPVGTLSKLVLKVEGVMAKKDET